MRKITFIGGGSAKFVYELVRDVLSFEELRETHICLMDIDAERLARAQTVVRKMIDDLRIGATVETTLDQRAALDGADYVIVTIMVGGFDRYRSDGEIPAKYGVLPTVGDTIGPGGVFRLVRNAPVFEQMADNLRQVAPDALVLNYANPLAMNCWALTAYGHRRTVGLCHSIQGTARMFAGWLGLPPEEVRYTAGGLNHVNYYLTLTHNGQDLYPRLLAMKDERLATDPHLRVWFELLEHLGHWPAEGPHHQSEYYPWFRKNQQAVDHYAVESFWGYHFDMKINAWRVAEVDDMVAGRKPIDYARGLEYGSYIIHSIETHTPRLFYGNVPNEGLIDNLPPDAVVEAPCHVDADGVMPCKVGTIPPQLAAVMTPHVHVHRMAMEAVMRKDRRLLRLAIQADPLTAMVCTLPQIAQMVDEMMADNAGYLEGWA
ncbi:MAG TPA: alpha-galactosidase [Phycisphaerae bacterium]|nr:alpha-galactosidase [Phycisphaerae bacterium]